MYHVYTYFQVSISLNRTHVYVCPRMEEIIERYQKVTGTCVPEHDARVSTYV